MNRGGGSLSRQATRLVSLLSRRQKVEFLCGVGIWLIAVGQFWLWWLQPEHVISVFTYCLISLILGWITLLPIYFLVMFFGAKRVEGDPALPEGTRVAMVVTKAPSEPFSVVAETLMAMLAQDYPHDTWLADEDPTPETLRWCAEHGVQVSTRRGCADYHRTTWPRRTRCKEGNLAYFYDHFGYDRYDLVAQLDADHVPQPTYLREMLKPFADPDVGYVSAPSICDSNAARSWSARGRLYVEASMHGSLQAGYTNGWAPLCIGSHYAVRTIALREIGGLGPELAEDHSTTLMMNAHRWRGVHAINAIAHGEGPRTFADLATQEFQWSRSLVTILLQYLPVYFRRLPPRLRFQFLFSELWYPLFSGFMAIMYAVPMIALLTDTNFVNVAFLPFMMHFAPVSGVLVVMAYRWRSTGTYRPSDARVLSWEGMLFLIVRWPWSLAGTIMAIRDSLAGDFVDFRVTPKGGDKAGPLPMRVLAPYFALSAAPALVVLSVYDLEAVKGFYVFAILNALIYAAALLTIILVHQRENGLLRRPRLTPMLLQPVLPIVLVALAVGAANVRAMTGLEALQWGAYRMALVEVTYGAVGAGHDRSDTRRVRFAPRFLSMDENVE